MNLTPLLLAAVLSAPGSPTIESLPALSRLSAVGTVPTPPTLESLPIPGEAAFVKVAKDILDIRFAMDPSIPAGDGLFEDAARVPSFDPRVVESLVKRIDADLAALRKLPWRRWEIDRQIDWRWMYAAAEDARLQLAEEKLFLHRPASWLEPLANTYIALLTYAPDRADIRERLTRSIPGMVEEMRRVAVSPTARDVKIAGGVIEGILSTLADEAPGRERDAAVTALSAYAAELESEKDLPEFTVIGAASYEKRLSRALLLPWSAREILALAQSELTDVDAALAALPQYVAPQATPEEAELAGDLDQDKLLTLYDGITREDRELLDRSDLLTVPAGVGPIRARPTPEAMIPLSGDGGSMNPPPPIGESNVGWWNVEHFKADWNLEKRTDKVVNALEQRRTRMGPYAAHEGVPGHHLQLSIARLNPNPLRNLLGDYCLIEGWAMYAEEIFWGAGGFGEPADSENRMLASWRGRIRRVFYDVYVECGDWTLQDAADFRKQTRRGEGTIDEDNLRAINWPAQLISYFCGKMQIRELKAAYREKLGPEYTDKKFHDALLAEGSIPVALIRAKLLGEPVPGPE